MRYSECEYLHDNNQCEIATQLATIPAFVLDNKACDQCIKQTNPKASNSVTASLALTSLKRNNSELYNIKFSELYNKYIDTTLKEGPGTKLHNLLLEKGYKITPQCNCLVVIRKMNHNGYDWCFQNAENEIAPTMIEEWKNRHWLVAKIVPNNFLLDGVLNMKGALGLISTALNRWYEKITSKK